MAGGGGALEVGHKPKRGKQSKRKAKKRLGFKLDMTPLVDITFLLLTFFMFTTTMLKPQVMEMTMPKTGIEEADIFKVEQCKLLTILVRPDNKVFWYSCDNQEAPDSIEISKLSALAVKMNLSDVAKNQLITTLKVSDKAKYQTVVKILDELNLAEGEIIAKLSQETDPNTGGPVKRERKFTFAPMTDEEMVKIDKNFVPAPKPEANKAEVQ
jgi:biopolymer transport protein ExbD